MRAGMLREQITIQARTDSVNAVGQPMPSWSTFAVVRAYPDVSRGREYVEAAGIAGVEPVQFRIRYLPGLTESHRIQWDGYIWDIVAPPEDVGSRHREMRVYATRGLTQG